MNCIIRGKVCEICGKSIGRDEIYCRECWRVVNAIMLEPERFVLVLKKLRNCKLCAKACKGWSQDV